MIPYGKQSISTDDLEAVQRVLNSGWLTTGPNVAEFEKAFAEYVGSKHAIAVSNGTAALHIAMLACGIGAGDRVVTSPNTFLASANAAGFVGATPDFSDIDPVSYNLCPDTLQKNWKSDTRGVVAVDYAGQAADTKSIFAIAKENDAFVIEDACHAVGGAFESDGQLHKIGGHRWADMTIFSFHPVKTMTTGEGGMVTTNSDDLASSARLARNHGMTRDPDLFQGLVGPRSGQVVEGLVEKGPWYYEMHELGYNYRITDFQCALGLSQLSRLDSFISRRLEIVDQYNRELKDIPLLQTPKLKDETQEKLTSWHLYTVQIDFAVLGKSRTEVMNELRSLGVGTQVLYIPVYLQPWYRKNYGYEAGYCRHAEDFYSRALSIPLFPTMSDADVDHVISRIRQVLS